MNTNDIVKATGQHQLFCGTETYSWSPDQFKQAAAFAAAHGVDCLLIKVADGTNIWYGGIDGWHNIRQAILAEGVGAIPYSYSYGSKFGALDAEIDIMIAYMQDCGIFCANMETEWNGDVVSAQHLCGRMQPVPGVFLVSTWADPSLQNWPGVISALAPCTTVFMPQQYTNSMARFWPEFAVAGAQWLQPTVSLTSEWGANDPANIAAAAYDQGHTAISVWEYQTAVAYPDLLDHVYAAFPKRSLPPAGQSVFMAQAAQDTWNSTAYLFGGTPLNYNTGIAQSWRNLYTSQHMNMPAPTTPEFQSVDWQGNPITVQLFGGTRCEWSSDAQPHWYQMGL